MTNQILMQQVSLEQLKDLVVSGIREEFSKLKEEIISKKTNEEIMTPKQVRDYLQCSTTTLFNWEQKGFLIPVRIEGLVRYKRKDVEQILELKT